jgi:hypothetical protein
MQRKAKSIVLAILGLYLVLSSWSGAAVSAPPDTGVPGPLAVTREEYSFGDTAFTPPGFPGPVELTASVHSPTDLSGGPFPLIVFLHGRHVTCFDGSSVFLQWPCSPPRQPIPSFKGYDYVAEILASHGYIVVSISANGINAVDNSTGDAGMDARARLVQEHLNTWNTFNTTGGAPFGGKFIGKVDLTKVGTMGHSRGGEGVVRHFIFNASLGSPYGIKAVLPLAPVDFSRPVINNVPLSVMLPYCDGDVSDLQGVHFFDDARYNVPGDATPKHTILVMGANHNFFNTIWTPGLFVGGSDDWGASSDPFCGTVAGNKRLTAAQQRGTGAAYIAGFFRLYMGGESAIAPLFRGDALPPPSAMTDQIFPSYHAPAPERIDVNRTLDAGNLSTNTVGGAVTQTGLTPYDMCGGESPQPLHCLPGEIDDRQPNTATSALSSNRGLSQLRLGWNAAAATYTNNLLGTSRNLSSARTLQFRASVNFADARNPVNVPQDCRVTLTDNLGAQSTVLLSNHSRILYYPPGTTAEVPKVILNTARIPLTAFSGIDFTNIESIKLAFDNPSGALLISDLALADANHAPIANAGPDQMVECTGHGGTSVTLNGTGSSDPDGDSLSFTWTGSFGTATGATPTVSLPLGTHVITLTVKDGLGASSTDTVTVKIVDTTPPVITSVTASPGSLWPPNHKLVPVTLTVAVTDLCSPTVDCVISNVSSNESPNGKGDGNTTPDWVITGKLTVELRAERSGKGSGRVYTITVKCTDASGNSASKSVNVTVAHDR